MKRTLYDGEYHRVADRAGMKSQMRRNVEFPDDDPENRTEESVRHVMQSRDDAVARLTGITEAEAAKRAEVQASLDARRAEFTEKAIRRQYADMGLDPPKPLVSLTLMRQLGWTIEQIDGKNVLMRPGRQNARKTREEWERERNGEGT